VLFCCVVTDVEFTFLLCYHSPIERDRQKYIEQQLWAGGCNVVFDLVILFFSGGRVSVMAMLCRN
jgi:hypothetical protein